MSVAVRESPIFHGEDVVLADAFDTRAPNLHPSRERYRPREMSIADEDEEDVGSAANEVAAIMTVTSSTPATLGPSSPPLDASKTADFVPPTRPSSTPFPNAQQGQTDIRCLTCQPDCFGSDDCMDTGPPPSPVVEQYPVLTLGDLPAEIHECILDHLFGYRVSTSSPSSLSIPSVNARSWSTALRHSRRKELSNLALVSPLWRDLIQQRLYRHIKIKATLRDDNDVMAYFVSRPHLRTYVKHIEIWFPVFQPRFVTNDAGEVSFALPTVSPEGIASAMYGLPMDNATLEEVFYLVSMTFPEVRVMTLEGGERKKAPPVQFKPPGRKKDDEEDDQELPQVQSVRTLIVKGQWNIIRQAENWEIISRALPSLEEWHGTYAKPKSKSYLSMAKTLETLDHKITKLNLCLECDYRREMACPPYYLKVCEQLHWCEKMAKAASFLEHLSYTGRICHGFFDVLAKCSNPRTTRLKTIDLTVKNCCRTNAQWNESGSGITDMHFIGAFEQLVLGAIRALERLKSVELLRIRYVDLDSPVPPLNPYFMIRDGWCSGVWSDQIVAELNSIRPDIRFEQMVESFGEVGYNKEGRLVISPDFPKSRVLSLKLANYAMLSGGITML
ncbi:Uu.00g030190.m01.CDS01 [Anthostomella pinea]|uniref:Uu.00g030190.m01.CDS01 n=1 Tax=Anthostomella pinea TaxID=933095 RepID=A0AAI8V890_9PEZI|nr:Uu.00g030190.m01.CDS01 [Anthostomella pinea]